MKINKGFTMIELLIVIGVLGILAVGVLAAVDPFEQLKKARDTNTRSSALALQTAFVRYYATHGDLPWDIVGVGCSGAFGAPDRTTSATPLAVSDATYMSSPTVGATHCVNLLEADGELKEGFVTALGTAVSASMWVNSPARAQAFVCFAPQSKSIFAEENTKFDNAGNDLSILAGAAQECTTGKKAANEAGSQIGDCFYCAK